MSKLASRAFAPAAGAPSVYSHAQLAALEFKVSRWAFAIVAVAAALALGVGLTYGWNAQIHGPIMLSWGAGLYAAIAAREATYQRYNRYVIAALLLNVVLVIPFVNSMTTLFYFPAILIFIAFGERNPVWRAGFTVTLLAIVVFGLCRFYPTVTTTLDAAWLKKVSINDAILGMLFGGLIMRYYINLLLKTRTAVNHIGHLAQLDTDRSRSLLDMAREMQDALEQTQAASTAAISRTRLRRARLTASREQQRQFTYAASHDLKEPIRTVRSFMQIVKRRLSPKQVEDLHLADHLNFVERSAADMHQVLESMLAYSRLEQATVKPEQVDVQLLWLRCCLQAGVHGAQEALAAHTASSATGDAQTYTDPRLLQQIFAELISNALRFTDQPCPRIELSMSRDEQGLLLCIADDGIGIDAAYHDQVFGLFKRLHARETYPGAGVGLALVRRLTELLGGTVWIEGARDEGTQVHLRLPSDPTAAQ